MQAKYYTCTTSLLIIDNIVNLGFSLLYVPVYIGFIVTQDLYLVYTLSKIRFPYAIGFNISLTILKIFLKKNETCPKRAWF